VSPGFASILCAVQAPAPPVGAALARALPASSTATHSEALAQETARRCALASIFAEPRAAQPKPGSVLVSTFPAASTATHSELVGQDTPVSARPSSIEAGGSQATAPPLGLVLTSARPPASTATHRAAEAQDTEVSGVASIDPTLQDGADAVGLVLVRTLPAPSTATQSASEGHEMALGAPETSMALTADQLSCGAAAAGAGAQVNAASASSNAIAGLVRVTERWVAPTAALRWADPAPCLRVTLVNLTSWAVAAALLRSRWVENPRAAPVLRSSVRG